MKVTFVIAWLAVCAIACLILRKRLRAERMSRQLNEPMRYVRILPLPSPRTKERA